MGNCGSAPKTEAEADLVPEPVKEDLVVTQEEVKVQQEEKGNDGNDEKHNAVDEKPANVDDAAQGATTLVNEVIPSSSFCDETLVKFIHLCII